MIFCTDALYLQLQLQLPSFNVFKIFRSLVEGGEAALERGSKAERIIVIIVRRKKIMGAMICGRER